MPSELIVNIDIPDKVQLEEALQQSFHKKVQIKHKVRENPGGMA